MTTKSISQYLERIGLHDSKTGLESLIKLQQHHIENIPFENLDVVVGREIDLDRSYLYNKIIHRGRGGYCFELNLLYAELLAALGFTTYPVLGRVWLRNPPSRPPRNHLAHLVKVNSDLYITDVGFGGLAPRIPLNIHDTSIKNDNDGEVRIQSLINGEFMIQRRSDNGWANQYSFELAEISEDDIKISNFYMSRNPASHFYKDRFIGKFNAQGRIGLFNNKFSKRNGINVVSTDVVNYGDEWIEKLRSEFNIELDFSNDEYDILFER
ncbi:MAG: arylamine N-acetyltransferase [Fulvivirga sp.]|uniref:arylamine N-acetyltransferase family protein n=1 Tax=Fulvivirga sp. TaxID=1931237 RepID=UPI0032EE4884